MVSTQKCSEVYAEKWSCVRVRDGAKNMVRNGAIYVERCDYSVCETTSAFADVSYWMADVDAIFFV